MPLYKLILLFSLIFPFVFRGHSQTQIIENIKSTRIFLNKKENSFLLFDDSTFYYKYKIAHKRWTKHPVTFKGDCDFNEFQLDFIPVASEKGDIYFVYRGCGEVYQLIDDTIRRIDRSFRHENQFDGNIFMYKDKISCFGGYGLFATKNFMSYFNLKFKEWMVDDIPFKCKIPEARKSAFSQQFREYFYIFGGRCSNSKEAKIFSDVWQYSFKTNRWKKLGKLNPNGINPKYWGWFDSEFANNKLIRLEDYMYVVDLHSNKVKRYSSEEFKMIDHPLFDNSETFICGILQKNELQKSVVVYHKNELLGKLDKSVDLYFDNAPSKIHFSTNLLLFLFVILFGFLSFLYFKKQLLRDKKLGTLYVKRGIYYLNGNQLSEEFNTIDFEVLMKFLIAKDHTLEIADINCILEYDNASIDAIKKRREQSIKNIRDKLSLYGKIPAEIVFISSQHPQDRRIKLLRLNPILLQTTTK
jgi:hypothetical protein